MTGSIKALTLTLAVSSFAFTGSAKALTDNAQEVNSVLEYEKQCIEDVTKNVDLALNQSSKLELALSNNAAQVSERITQRMNKDIDQLIATMEDRIYVVDVANNMLK